MIEATIAGSALVLVAGAWRWHTADKQALARRTALRLMAYAAGLDAREAAVAEARITLAHPVFGDPQHIYARELLERSAELWELVEDGVVIKCSNCRGTGRDCEECDGSKKVELTMTKEEIEALTLDDIESTMEDIEEGS